MLTGGSGVAKPRWGEEGNDSPQNPRGGKGGDRGLGAARSSMGGTTQGQCGLGWAQGAPTGNPGALPHPQRLRPPLAWAGGSWRGKCSLEGSLCPRWDQEREPSPGHGCREQPGSASTSPGKENPKSTLCPHLDTEKWEPSPSHPHSSLP